MQEQEKEQAQLAAINEIIKTIGSSLDLRQVYDTFATQLKKLVAFDRASITLIEGDNLRFFALSSATESELDEERVVPLEGTATQWVAAHKEAYIADDLAKERQFWTEDIRFQEGLKSRIHIPLFSRGEIIGTFNLNSRQPNAYGEKERQILEQITGPLAVAIENFRLFKQAKATAEELQRSEEHFRALIENASDIILVLDSDGTIRYGSPSYERVLGYKPQDLVGKKVFEFFHPDDAPDAISGFTKVIRDRGTTRSYEHRFRHKDGSWRFLEARGRTLTDDSGKVSVVVNARDITERKRVEVQIQKQTYELGERVKELDCLYGISDLAGKRGISLEEMLQGVVDLIPPTWRYPEITCARVTLEGQEFRTKNFRETAWKQASDIILHGELIGTLEVCYLEEEPEADEGPFLKEERSLVNAIAERLGDITERKQAEEALKTSDEKFRSLVEDINDAYVVVRKDRIIFANQRCAELYGYRLDELIGQPFTIRVAPEAMGEAREILQKSLRRESVPERYELMAVRKDGTRFPVEVSLRAITYEGRPAFSVIERDITERKQAEEALLRHAKREEGLHAIAQTVNQSLELDQMLNSALDKVLEVVEVDAGYITFFDVETRRGFIKAYRGLSEQFVGQIGGEERDEDVRRWQEHREPAFGLRRIYSEPTLTKVLVAAENEALQSFVTVPLWSKDVLHGALVLASHAPRRFSTDDLELLKAISSEIAVGIENARLFEEVRNAAITDGLTGLYNHRHFQERLEEEVARALRFGGECSLVMLDLDYFKIYNDLFGHVAGDEALRRLGQVIRDHTRQVDMACRYGGEEFAVILPQTGPLYAYQAAERLRQAAETAFALESSVTSTNLTVSLGVASCPGDALSREELIQRADLALREAKDRGRNQTCSASELLGAATGKGKEGWEIMQHLKAAGPNKVYALAAGVDARDHYTYGHSQNVSRHAVAIGQALGLPDVEIKQLRIVALLHDIGKIGLSDSIIRKPGPLDAEEWKTMKKHSELGATIISHMPELADCAPTIRHHHEWYDGSGYPSGLKGEDIPLAARIIAIADAYDTMTTPRSYRQMVSPEEALEELRRCAKTQFDPLLVETFARLVTAGVEGTS